ncbi:Krueppel-like factor 3 [Orchesella cincta]|uniref:Krueppel-like factor 3 n=1 Tax=Orchesella cincta TaxID=48709 RepID=A0A1D2MQ93_ORCCI|nr:Krueppel-like factor 3 [Orchesella cincta]
MYPPNQNEIERLSSQLGVQSSTPASPLPLLSPSGEMEVVENVVEMSATRSSCEQPSQPTIRASTSPPPQSEPEPTSVEVQINAAPPSTSSEAEVEEISPTNNLCQLPAPPFIDTPTPQSEPERPDRAESVETMIESLIGNITVPQAPQLQRRVVNCDFEGCGRSFATAANFRIHYRVHTGEKPFQCQWPGCLHRFARKSLLKTHSRLHVITTPFQCEPCNLFLNNTRHLALHLKTVEHLEASRIMKQHELSSSNLTPNSPYGRKNLGLPMFSLSKPI